MKKPTLYKILAVLIVVILFFYSLIQVFRSAQKSQNNNQNPGGLSISTQAGEVKVKDFTVKPKDETKDSITAEKSAGFSIAYFKNDQSFLITLEAEPLKQNRLLAEQELLKMLQIDEQSACRLKVSLVIPYEISPALSGKDYGLSFCPAGISF